MGKLVLYGMDASPPVRACQLALKALALPYEYKRMDWAAKEHLTEEFKAKNPQHTVPTLEDDGNYIWDSHVIMSYLVSKYGKSDDLYPRDLLKRAVVDQRLHFETGVMFSAGMRNITEPLFFRNESTIPRYRIDALVQIYEFLEAFLKDHAYIAGDKMTIADFSILSTLTTVNAFIDIDANKFPKLTAWLKRMQELPYYEEANGKGAEMFTSVIKAKNFPIV